MECESCERGGTNSNKRCEDYRMDLCLNRFMRKRQLRCMRYAVGDGLDL